MALKVVVRSEVAEALLRRYRLRRPPMTLTEIGVEAVTAWAERVEADAHELRGPKGVTLKPARAPFPEPLGVARRGAPLRGEAQIIGGVPFSFRVAPELELRVRAAAWWLGLRLSWVVDEALARWLGVPIVASNQAPTNLDDDGAQDSFDEPNTMSQRVPRLHHITPSPDGLPTPVITPKPSAKP
jgi:hypothetical protein